jgi:excisionase family DNA binding protein
VAASADDGTYSIAEVAALLGVSDDLIYKAVDRKELPAIRVGKRVRIPQIAIARLHDAAMEGWDPKALRVRKASDDA